MNILFDNNLSPHIAHAMRELSKVEKDVESVIHLRDRFIPNTPDVEWIKGIGDGWVILSLDRFTKSQDAERAALRQAGHTAFVLDRQWSEQRFWLQAERLVRWWPQILAQARLVSAGGFRVPWHHGARVSLHRYVCDPTIGDDTQIGPGVQIYGADHPRDPAIRVPAGATALGNPARIRG